MPDTNRAKPQTETIASLLAEERERRATAPLGVKPAEAARMLGESIPTIYRHLGTGKLRAVKRGVTTLVLTASIYEFFDSLPPAVIGAAGSTLADHAAEVEPAAT
jgi:Helix-turn-helix domain